MTTNEIRRALKRALVIIALYAGYSTLAGIAFAMVGIGSFGNGFALGLLSAGAAHWLIKYGTE